MAPGSILLTTLAHLFRKPRLYFYAFLDCSKKR
ncbi:hypothetical protein ADUPG1_003917, partial [Aduncisulcus paluster]